LFTHKTAITIFFAPLVSSRRIPFPLFAFICANEQETGVAINSAKREKEGRGCKGGEGAGISNEMPASYQRQTPFLSMALSASHLFP
jgi:hypothetical protein